MQDFEFTASHARCCPVPVICPANAVIRMQTLQQYCMACKMLPLAGRLKEKKLSALPSKKDIKKTNLKIKNQHKAQQSFVICMTEAPCQSLGRNPGRQVARIVIYISADLPPPFSSGRGGPQWRLAPAVSCLALIKGPGYSSIFFG